MNLFQTEPRPLPETLKKAGFVLLLFLCWFIPFRVPLADLTLDAIKALPDVLVLLLAVWYAIEIRFRFRFQPQDILFLAFEAVALVSTVLVNRLPVTLFIYQTRSIGIYYILYFTLRNFGLGERELVTFTKHLQAVSVPLFLLALVEKITSKTMLFSKAVLSGINASSNFSRVYSMFYNPNTYGLFLIFTILLSLWLALYGSYRTRGWIYALLATSLYMTMSRSSMLILAAGLALLLVLALREKKLQWKPLAKDAALVLLCVLAIPYLSGVAAARYYDARAQYQLMDRIREGTSQAAYITEVSYTAPDGTEHTGYVFYDITYLDKECTTPLNEYGCIVHTKNASYILTKEGGKKVEEFYALPQSEQDALLEGGSGWRRDENRDNQVLSNVRDSFDVSSGTRFGELKDQQMYTSDYNGRLYSVVMAGKILRDHPVFGTGFGTFGSSASLTWEPPIYRTYKLRENFYADNQYACVLAETGALGFVLFFAFLLCTLLRCKKALLKVIACVTIGWFGLFYNILEVQIGAFLLWSILSFCETERKDEGSDQA